MTFLRLYERVPITEYTSNNNKGVRGRSRGKPWDEFALIEASPLQMQAYERETPQLPVTTEVDRAPTPTMAQASMSRPTVARGATSKSNVLLAGQPFATALTNTSVVPADKPDVAIAQATPRVDRMKTVRIRYFDLERGARSTVLEVPADSYIAEILDNVCKKWGFQKGHARTESGRHQYSGTTRSDTRSPWYEVRSRARPRGDILALEAAA